MQPTWESADGSIKLFHGDCRDILPTLTGIDCILTDPPYGLGDKWNGGAGGAMSSWKSPPGEAKQWDMTTCVGVEPLFSRPEEVIVWGANYYATPPARCWLLWDKKQPDTWTTANAEMAWTNLDRPVRRFSMAACEFHGSEEKRHPTQKPLELMVWCLKWFRSKNGGGQVICDPYMGSGTTGVACVKNTRRFIGIEKEERYFDIAVERIQNAMGLETSRDGVTQRRMFVD